MDDAEGLGQDVALLEVITSFTVMLVLRLWITIVDLAEVDELVFLQAIRGGVARPISCWNYRRGVERRNFVVSPEINPEHELVSMGKNFLRDFTL